MMIQVDWQDIQFNSTKTLFSAISFSELTMHVLSFKCRFILSKAQRLSSCFLSKIKHWGRLFS